MQQHPYLDANHPWLSAWSIFAVIVPHIAMVVMAFLNYRTSQSNNRKLSRVETALNGKGHDAAEAPRSLDGRQ